MQTVRVSLGPRSYDIALTTADPGGVGPFVRRCLPKSQLALVVGDGRARTTEPVKAGPKRIPRLAERRSSLG